MFDSTISPYRRAPCGFSPAPERRSRSSKAFTLLHLLLAASLLLPASAASQEDALHPGDLVRITVWRNAELSGEFPIGEGGAPLHPLYREVPLTGMSMREAENRLRAFLSEYEATPRFVLEPLFRVAVGGEVERADLYTFPPGTTVTEAVALAGGPTESAALNRVILLRDGQEIEADLTRPQSGRATSTVRSGDQIVVPEDRAAFRDYVLPVVSFAGAVVSIVHLVLR